MTRPLPEAFTSAIAAQFPDDFLTTDPHDLVEYGRDWTRVYTPAPAAVAFPRSTDEVARLMKLCAAQEVAIVPSGGRTGLAGGAVAIRGELVVSLRRMNHMDEVDLLPKTVRVQAGAVTQAVHEHAGQHNLTWPVDFASKGSSTIGGNIATNAGGVKVIRYGHTRNWVLGLQVVTAAGEVLELNGSLEKNNTGLDLRQLFIGSEGTLGIVTEATLKLIQKPRDLVVMLISLQSFTEVLKLFSWMDNSGFVITAFEFFTDRCAARLKRHRDVTPPFAEAAPFYGLIELEHPSRSALFPFLETLMENLGIIDGTISSSEGQARELWTLREGISESLSATGLPHKNDVAVPLGELQGFYHDLEEAFAARYPGWEICLFGHIGDGNIHINVMKPDDMPKDEFLEHTHAADEVIFEIVRAHQGSISAEHGVGLIKKDFLHYSRSAGELEVLRAVKRALDPRGILNPGKIFDL